MAEMGKNRPIPNVPTGNEGPDQELQISNTPGPDGDLLLRKQ